MNIENQEKEIKSTTRNILLFLLSFLGLGAVAGGGALIIYPSGMLLRMPLSILVYSPFNNFLIPGIILFSILGIVPIGLTIALIKKPENKFAELFNFFKDMYWAWTFCIYIAFALIIWIQFEMIFLRAVQWLHIFYTFWALVIIFFALLPQIRSLFKR